MRCISTATFVTSAAGLASEAWVSQAAAVGGFGEGRPAVAAGPPAPGPAGVREALHIISQYLTPAHQYLI